jgi:hypothetical protein
LTLRIHPTDVMSVELADDAVVLDVDFKVIEVGVHNWDVFELVDTESVADSEVVFGWFHCS